MFVGRTAATRDSRALAMQINMTTFAGRNPHYIHQTLQSLFRSDWADSNVPINLIMGSEDESHVQEYASHPAIRIVRWNVKRESSLRLNCTVNKIRALCWGDDDATLTCEDDIAFSATWMSSLKLAAAELAGKQYVLSLFAARPLLAKANLVEGKTRIRHYPTRALQGAQAIFYPSKELRLAAAEYLEINLRKGCGDHLIGKYARSFAALYVTDDILVDHIGAVSCFPP
jgi:hypothetical protein